MKENELKTTVADYLQIGMNQGKWYYDRLNSGDFIEVRGDTRRRIKGCRKGTADFLVLQKTGCWGTPRVLFVELKGDKGRQNEEQREFQHLVEEQGAMYAIIKSVEELEEVLGWR